jgi:BirA family biotin operon repressor/biotin-[acetyl-CoA-carboxylase] ligase
MFPIIKKVLMNNFYVEPGSGCSVVTIIAPHTSGSDLLSAAQSPMLLSGTLLNLPKNTTLLPHENINNSMGMSSFIELQSVDSTNNYAMQQTQQNLAQHGSAYFAHDQFAGKGQRGKQWTSKPGNNIILSVVFNTSELEVSDQFSFSISMALAAHDLLKSYVARNIFLKWPNDLYWNDRKAGGILIENIIRGRYWQWAIVGLGININQTIFDPLLPNPVSLKQITGKTNDAVKLAKELVNCLQNRYQRLTKGDSQQLLIEYNSVLYKRNSIIKLKKENAVFEALLKGVNTKGQLIIEAGVEQIFEVGQVEWII